MNELPTWWLMLSALAFIVNAAAFLALAFGVLRLATVVKELQPRLNAIAERVDALTVKVDAIAGDVKEFTEKAKGTMASVGGGTSAIVRALASSTQRLERASPFLVLAVSAFKLFQGFRASKSRHDDDA